jgi:pyruvate/2-oxoglutarate dehydrogenase complex dihydrolipoamide dehydrogenase (E3) component
LKRYDAVVIGAGPGGEVCAAALAKGGMSVAIIERERVGGECAFWGCIPSKTLLRSFQPAAEARQTPGSRNAVSGDLSFDSAAQWRSDNVDHYDDASHLPFLHENHVELIRGEAHVSAQNKVTIGGEEVEFGRLVIATGSDAAIPHLPGLQNGAYWTNREATAATEVPPRLVVLGGGAVGVELAQVFARYGSRVTILESAMRILSSEDDDVAFALGKALQTDGVELRTQAPAKSVRASGTGVSVEADGRWIEGDRLLVATGRTPRSSGFGFERLGVALDRRGAIKIDERCRAAENAYAVGDVTGVAMFTHVAKYQGRIAAAAALGKPSPAKYDAIPRCIFTVPEVAAVGPTARELAEKKIDAVSATAGFDEVARSVLYEEETVAGLLRLTADRGRGVLVAGAIVGPMASEMVGIITAAIRNQTPLRALLDVVQPFPTFSEVFFSAAERLAEQLKDS